MYHSSIPAVKGSLFVFCMGEVMEVFKTCVMGFNIFSYFSAWINLNFLHAFSHLSLTVLAVDQIVSLVTGLVGFHLYREDINQSSDRLVCWQREQLF
jgi:hypothetical protein